MLDLVGNPEDRFSQDEAHNQEQSDQGFHCLLFHLHLLDEIPWGLASFLEY